MELEISMLNYLVLRMLCRSQDLSYCV